ncbi:hypothetical protein D3C71_1421340 [compost metagenome]
MRLFGQDRVDRRQGAERLGAHLQPSRALQIDGQIGGFFHRVASSEIAVMRKQDGLLFSQRGRDKHAFLVRDRHTRPFAQECAVIKQGSHVHLGHDQRLTRRCQRGRPRRMRMDDRLNVRPVAIDPKMKTGGRVGHAVA